MYIVCNAQSIDINECFIILFSYLSRLSFFVGTHLVGVLQYLALGSFNIFAKNFRRICKPRLNAYIIACQYGNITTAQWRVRRYVELTSLCGRLKCYHAEDKFLRILQIFWKKNLMKASCSGTFMSSIKMHFNSALLLYVFILNFSASTRLMSRCIHNAKLASRNITMPHSTKAGNSIDPAG